jgi:hypothetical protein
MPEPESSEVLVRAVTPYAFYKLNKNCSSENCAQSNFQKKKKKYSPMCYLLDFLFCFCTKHNVDRVLIHPATDRL